MDDTVRKPAESPLKDAIRAARIEAAERSAVVVDLRDAEAARLEILNEALDPAFRDIPPEHADIFDRGLSQGSQPRLWIDMVTHIAMGRDKRTYRLLHDTANGRRVLSEASEGEAVAEAGRRSTARGVVAGGRAIAATEPLKIDEPVHHIVETRPARARVVAPFILGMIVGAIALFAFGVYLTR